LELLKHKEDLDKFAPAQWYTDAAIVFIAAACNYMVAKLPLEQQNMYFIPSFVLYGNESLLKEKTPPLKKIHKYYGYHDDANIEFLYAPAYTQDHFIMLRYDVKLKRVHIMDSLYNFDDGGKHAQIVQQKINLFDQWLEQNGFEKIVELSQCSKTVRQPDCHSCGVVVCHLMLECVRRRQPLRMLSEQGFFEPENLIARRVEHKFLCSQLVVPLSWERHHVLLEIETAPEPVIDEPSDPNEVELIEPQPKPQPKSLLGKRLQPEEEKKEEMAPQRVPVAMTEMELKLYELEEERQQQL
jgi:hypothetical protein